MKEVISIYLSLLSSVNVQDSIFGYNRLFFIFSELQNWHRPTAENDEKVKLLQPELNALEMKARHRAMQLRAAEDTFL